jgi:hypothetical protein
MTQTIAVEIDERGVIRPLDPTLKLPKSLLKNSISACCCFSFRMM